MPTRAEPFSPPTLTRMQIWVLALGLTEEEVNAIVPVSKMKQLAKERTGANDQNSFYKLNPEVSDLPEKLAKDINGVKLLVMGTVDTGGTGCVCPST